MSLTAYSQMKGLDEGGFTKAKKFLNTHNPATAEGRSQIKEDITRSGPVVWDKLDSEFVQSAGIRGKWNLEGGAMESLHPSSLSQLARLQR